MYLMKEIKNNDNKESLVCGVSRSTFKTSSISEEHTAHFSGP